ncbi:hypothetical protein CRG98_010645 [Punica granatum]|uniref:Integrase catalytic domain-containing protein n=1 Tax=Punica granatum TaxID=22663 RepID=A0A2I0KKB3_PUNGR|nr:hypothetical protein CRG98_010645 [Punica granatum]
MSGTVTCAKSTRTKSEHRLTSCTPWPFSMWGIDVIGHLFILVAIDYFTKWIEAITLASVTAKAVARFFKRDIITRYKVPATLITDNAKNLNNNSSTSFVHSSRYSIATPLRIVPK